ncbi:ABC transporter, ATP-binding protein [Atopobium sp. oral taxon 810 str. F0209]|nr:ABC transporter, ATP-binding protein [Atopobium sp. oral taxon 810 str. F0209]
MSLFALPCTEDGGHMAAILNVDKLAFSYGKTPVWEDISFSLGEGDIAFLVGRNGSGKSTLLKCLAGWIAPTAGKICFAGEGIRCARTFVSDVPSFYDDLTAREHVQLLLRAGKMEDRLSRAQDLLAEFGLGRALDQYPSSYSRGMRLKLALSLAFVMRPKLLLLDEPYGPLDAEASAVLDREVTSLTVRGSSVLVSCHAHASDLVPNFTLALRDGALSYA